MISRAWPVTSYFIAAPLMFRFCQVPRFITVQYHSIRILSQIIYIPPDRQQPRRWNALVTPVQRVLVCVLHFGETLRIPTHNKTNTSRLPSPYHHPTLSPRPAL